jgi:anti-sigma B factor antagonist
MSTSSLSTFAVSVDFMETQVVLGVRGELDMDTAPELGALVDAAIGQGYQSVVLDMAELAFMDASGLRVIAGGASRLRPSGGEVVLRSPPPIVQRILDITRLTEVVRLEPEPVDGVPGKEHLVGTPVAAASPCLVAVAPRTHHG